MYVQQQYHHQHQYTSYSNYSFNDNSHSTSLNHSSTYLDKTTSNGRLPSIADLPAQSSADHTIDTESSLMQSVKEQEEQFERLQRELEAERRSVAEQLDQYNKLSSMAGSLRSLNSGTADNQNTQLYHQQDYHQYDHHQNGTDMSTQQYQYNHQQTHQTNHHYTYNTDDRDYMSDDGEDMRPDPGANESSHLVDSCLRVLEERGIINQHDDDQARQGGSKNVSFNPSAGYMNGGYNSQYDDNQSDTSQYSYRQPQGNGMTRSHANYSLHDAAADTEVEGPRTINDEYRDYREPVSMTNASAGGYLHSNGSRISDGDYIDSNTASKYLNNERDNPDNLGQLRSAEGDYMYQSGVSDTRADSYRESSPQQQVSRVYGSKEQLNSSRNPSYNYRGSREQLSAGPQDMYAHNRDYMDDGMLYPQNGDEDHQDQYAGQTDSLKRSTDNLYLAETIPKQNLSRSYLNGSHFSLASRMDGDQRWRKPDLPEVIEYLSHPNDAIKANAAAYLQHLCYGNNNVKERTRQLKGIPALVNLLSSDIPELHRNALGALLNLSRGYENDDNKRSIKTCGGIEALAALLARSRDNDVRELITGLLWNLSSLGELKRTVITVAVPTLVREVIYPASDLPGATSNSNYPEQRWSTEFRNSTGVLRNVSSAGPDARASLRQCEGLIDALLNVVRAVIGKAEMDNKPVENVVCTLRNLSFRLMEIDYPDYYTKQAKEQQERASQNKSASNDIIPGCFGKSARPVKTTIEYPCRTPVGSRKGEQLWQPNAADLYLPLLSDCSNTDTLEAAVGAIQNLTACEWEPSVNFREHIRKRKGLPTIVELLGLEEADNVVCGAAIALRNLALDKSNKTLIGKYAISQLVSKLPSITSNTIERCKSSEETIRAVLATLHEVFKDKDADSAEHASTLVNDTDGLTRLMTIAKSKRKYSMKTLRGVHQLLSALWRFSNLREQYKAKGYKESDFLSKSMLPRAGGDNAGTLSIASTLTRLRSEPPSNTNTLNTINRSNTALYRDDQYDEKAAQDYPTTDTLPIQRPLYQPPSDDMYYSRDRDSQLPNKQYNGLASSGGWQQGTFNNPNYNQNASAPSNELYGQNSYRYNQAYTQDESHTNPATNSETEFGQPKGEPLYARVQKKKPNDVMDHSFTNNAYQPSNTRSMESLQLRVDDDNQRTPMGNNLPDVDSWV